MARNKKSNDQSIVDEQIENIFNNFYKDKNITLCNKIRNSKTDYGTPYFLKEKDYEQSVLQIIDDNKYFILLKDQSIINICYSFDDKGKMLKHTLSYIPLNMSKSYIRIDYNIDEASNNSAEPPCHIHLSTIKNDCRIPSLTTIMPNDFLYIILKYFYDDESSFVNSLKIGYGEKVCEKKYKILLVAKSD